MSVGASVGPSGYAGPMTVRLAVDAHQIRVELHDSGHLVVSPKNPAAAIAFLHLNRREDVVLTPDLVEAVRDMVPSPHGVATGWVDVCGPGGHMLRIPYRPQQAPYVRELLRVMEQDHGYPARQEIGVREDPEPIALELPIQPAML